MSDWLGTFTNEMSGKIILAILALDTIRAVIAFTGIVPRDTKILGRIIYGKYDEDLIALALVSLGYTKKVSKEEFKNLKSYIGKIKGTTSVTPENAPVYLILLMAKYCVKFQNPIAYGGDTLTQSRYYIDTMEMVHDNEDLKTLCHIIIELFNSVTNEKPGVIFTPKGGNPLLTAKVAELLKVPFIFVKSANEKSKIQSNDMSDSYRINYEGSWTLENFDSPLKCVVVDCNLSGGSQIKHIVEEVNELSSGNANLSISKIEDVFFLFRVDDKKQDLETSFQNLGVKLHRYFDLNEDIKDAIYKIAENAKQSDRRISMECVEDVEKAKEIISKLKETKKYYYKI